MSNLSDIGALSREFEAAKHEFELGHYDQAREIAGSMAQSARDNAKIVDVSSPKSPTYSIIVLSYIHSADVEALIASLNKYSDSEAFEVVLVDNGNHELEAVARRVLKRFSLIRVGFNYGCSGGRNIGAHFAKGKYITFIDDDGALGEGAIEKLISAIESYGAAAVRGKVLPRTESNNISFLRNPGKKICRSRINAEGISIWRRDLFNRFGGFDVLLSGQEGNLLCYRMVGEVSARRFLYTPHAVLFHDYAEDDGASKKKAEKHKRNEAYLDVVAPQWRQAKRALKGRVGDLLLSMFPKFRMR